MPGPSVSSHVETLRQEIRNISCEERLYHQAKFHSPEEIMARGDRELRLAEIHSQLEALVANNEKDGSAPTDAGS